METNVLKPVPLVNMVTLPTRNVRNAQKIVPLVMDQLMTNVIVVNQNGSYMKANVSNHAQKVIMDMIDNVTHVTLTVKLVSDPSIQNVTHVPKDSSLPMMDTLVSRIVQMNSTETQRPEHVMFVMEHVAHVTDQILPTVHHVATVNTYLELNV
jgi:hypothetical protein